MISKLTVLHRGGAVLWTSDSGGEDKVGPEPINWLIQNILLSDHAGEAEASHNAYKLKWTFANNFNLVFVAVYVSIRKMLYIDDFLETVKREFLHMFSDSLRGGIANLTPNQYSFEQKYKRIQKFFSSGGKAKNAVPKQFHETKRGKDVAAFRYGDREKAKSKSDEKNDDDDDDSGRPTNGLTRQNSGPRPFDPKRKGRGGKTRGKKGKGKGKKKKGKGKEGRSWGIHGKVTEEDMNELDMTDPPLSPSNAEEKTDDDLYVVRGPANLEESDSESEDDYIPLEAESDAAPTGWWGKISSLVSDRPLNDEDLAPVLRDLEQALTQKNVANAIAIELCNSVRESLVGRQVGTFTSVRFAVREAMREALERILTPTTPVNLLHGIATARAQGRPYVITFIGVNGVGKSTSLSKVIYYLQSRNLQVSVAACDTFRSGAIEQLKTHCQALKCRLFFQRYGADPSSVAASAIRKGAEMNDDVVLVDTAGRMQNNDKLMRELVSLIQRNNPDLVLFVGEALVGNDGVDQLVEFNRALQTLSSQAHPRTIDGILLTKFDCVDDKVGASISMTYRSGKPVIFLGVGQTYADLKRVHVGTLLNKLMA